MSAAGQAAFEWIVRVYYEDTDTGGIVFYANYLRYFERARTEWLRRGGCGMPGISQQRIADELGLMFVVRSTSVDYRRPARLDDALRIDTTVERLGRVGIDFFQQAWVRRAEADVDELVAVGRIKVGCVSRDAMRPMPIPDAVRAIFTGNP